MAEQSGGNKFLMVLGVGVIGLLGAAGWYSTTQSDAGGQAANDAGLAAGAEALALEARVQVLAGQALNGQVEAMEPLERSYKQLRRADTGALSRAQKDRIKSVTDNAKVVVDNADSLESIRAAEGRLRELNDELREASYELEASISTPRQAELAEEMERVQLLAASLLRDVQIVIAGTEDADTVGNRMVGSKLSMAQVLRTLEADPVGSEEGTAALESVKEIASQIDDQAQIAMAVADRLVAPRNAQASMQKALLTADTSLPKPSADQSQGFPVLLALLGGAGLLVLVMIGMVLRSARSVVNEDDYEDLAKAGESDKNQQAILRLLDELGSLADGDLTVQATVTEDVTGAIADSINYTIEALRELVATINDSAIMVDAAARQTQAAGVQLSSASESQSRQIKGASDSIARMAASIDEVSGNAERSSDVARHSVDVAHKGGDAVRRTIEGMNTIRETIQDTSKRIKRLGESSQEIGNIVELITDIADQTNILALNASIQASMAGEAGRGFAVVADEVQRLAERSANATKQIELLVRTIQTDTNEAVVSMERSTTDVVGGALLAENAGAALEEIEQVSNQIASLVQNISVSAREQASAAEDVMSNMDQLSEINTRTDESTDATTSSISKLAELATQLRRSVSGFILPDAASESAVLKSVVLRKEDIEASLDGEPEVGLPGALTEEPADSELARHNVPEEDDSAETMLAPGMVDESRLMGGDAGDEDEDEDEFIDQQTA